MTTQTKNWIADNFKWILTMFVIGLSNYFIIAGQVSKNADRNDEQDIKLERMELRQENFEKSQVIRDEMRLKQMHEFQINLKVFMEKNGIKYQKIDE
jgi:hypothetical protein